MNTTRACLGYCVRFRDYLLCSMLAINFWHPLLTCYSSMDEVTVKKGTLLNVHSGNCLDFINTDTDT